VKREEGRFIHWRNYGLTFAWGRQEIVKRGGGGGEYGKEVEELRDYMRGLYDRSGSLKG